MSNCIRLNDILHLSTEELNNTKITLNMKDTNSWLNSEKENRNVAFSYWSQQGITKNYHEGNINIGFIKIDYDKWLLITIGKILKVPEVPDVCDYEELDKFNHLFGRLIIKLYKGNKYSRYAFNLHTFLNEIEVVEYLPGDYEESLFKGFDNISLDFYQLKDILDGKKDKTYKKALETIKGVYVLTDKNNGKLYVGSAYGDNGFAQRWKSYVDTFTGGNKELERLRDEFGEDYFAQNFNFTVLEYYGMNYENDKIIRRESYWKQALQTRRFGYNVI